MDKDMLNKALTQADQIGQYVEDKVKQTIEIGSKNATSACLTGTTIIGSVIMILVGIAVIKLLVSIVF